MTRSIPGNDQFCFLQIQKFEYFLRLSLFLYSTSDKMVVYLQLYAVPDLMIFIRTFPYWCIAGAWMTQLSPCSVLENLPLSLLHFKSSIWWQLLVIFTISFFSQHKRLRSMEPFLCPSIETFYGSTFFKFKNVTRFFLRSVNFWSDQYWVYTLYKIRCLYKTWLTVLVEKCD